MDELLSSIAQSFDGAGFPATSHQRTLTIVCVKIPVEMMSLRSCYIAGRRFRKMRGYWNTTQIVAHILATLPALKQQQEESEQRQACHKVADQLAKDHREDSRLKIGYYANSGYFATFSSHDFTEVAVACDMLREISYGMQPKPKREGPRKYMLLYHFEISGQEFTLEEIADSTLLDLAYFDLDEVVDLLVGESLRHESIQLQRTN